jgi:hypothetical protein
MRLNPDPRLTPPRRALSVPGQRTRPGVLDTTGNEAISPFPATLPGAGTTTAPNAPQMDNTLPSVFPMFEVAKYGSFQSIALVLAVDSTLELISEPSGIRGYLNIRSDATSVGTLAIALNQQPQNVQQANWVINTGESKEFNSIIPQNRIFGTALGGAVQVTVTWMNFNLPSK